MSEREAEIAQLLEQYREAVDRLGELGICPKDAEPMPCMTCGAGL